MSLCRIVHFVYSLIKYRNRMSTTTKRAKGKKRKKEKEEKIVKFSYDCLVTKRCNSVRPPCEFKIASRTSGVMEHGCH